MGVCCIGQPRQTLGSRAGGELTPNAAPRKRTYLIDHKHAVQVVRFVLDRNGQEPFGFELEWPTVTVERTYSNPLGTFYLFRNVRERKAPSRHTCLPRTSRISGLMKTRSSLGSPSAAGSITKS